MNRTVKSCFAAGAAFAALALASGAQAQWAMATSNANGAAGRFIDVTVSVTSGAANVAQATILYDSTFLTVVPSIQGGVDLTAGAIANGWSEQAQTDAQLQPTSALWPTPQKAIKALVGNATATAISGAFLTYHFQWTGAQGSTQIAFASSRFPGTQAPSGARTRTSNSGVIVQDTFTTGNLTLTAVPAPSAVLAFAAGLPMLGVALRRRK